MRELDRHPHLTSAHAFTSPLRVAIIGNGRAGNALARALRHAGDEVDGPLSRGAVPADADAVLLCVPDAEIAGGAALIPAGPAVGHCSGATGLEVLTPHRCFSLHPLMTIPAAARADVLVGAGAAVAGDSAQTLDLARALAIRVGMRPIEIAPGDRAAYHAAASMASNFLITLEAAAERLAATAGVEHADLVPLVRATVENWARLGAARALTGPVARGDDRTVAAQREAVLERVPEMAPLFDALVDATRALAGAGAAA
ncbi:MAG TPA: DUF2520 domain-containing protein [Solirubrobacteraceae bacterium]|nr:DUF2520 domain-containing protein [Solirubrobacteraceae bacterium]